MLTGEAFRFLQKLLRVVDSPNYRNRISTLLPISYIKLLLESRVVVVK